MLEDGASASPMLNKLRELEAKVATLKSGSGDGTSDDMGRIWAKLEQHDAALHRIEADLVAVKTHVGHLPSKIELLWGGAAFVITIAVAVLTIGSYMSGTMSTALGAIQTVIAERPPVAASASSQPTIIVVPTPQPIVTPAPPPHDP